MSDEPITFWNARIRVWTPIDPRDPCLAKIGHESPILFSGPTPLAVKRAAEAWREAEKAKREAQRAAAEERAQRRRTERGMA